MQVDPALPRPDLPRLALSCPALRFRGGFLSPALSCPVLPCPAPALCWLPSSASASAIHDADSAVVVAVAGQGGPPPALHHWRLAFR